jgi:hypothetical protein
MLVVRRRVSLARSEIARLAAMLMHAGQYALQLVDKLVDEPGRVSPGPVASTKATVAHAVPFSHKIIAKAEAAVLVRQRRDEWGPGCRFWRPAIHIVRIADPEFAFRHEQIHTPKWSVLPRDCRSPGSRRPMRARSRVEKKLELT